MKYITRIFAIVALFSTFALTQSVHAQTSQHMKLEKVQLGLNSHGQVVASSANTVGGTGETTSGPGVTPNGLLGDSWTSGYGKYCGAPDAVFFCSDIRLEITFYFYYSADSAYPKKGGPYCSEWNAPIRYANLTWVGASQPNPQQATGGCNWSVGSVLGFLSVPLGLVMQRIYGYAGGSWRYAVYTSN